MQYLSVPMWIERAVTYTTGSARWPKTSTIHRHKIKVGNWEIKSSSIFFNLLRGYEKGIFSKSDVGMSITILFLQTPQSNDKSSSFERKIPSLSLNLSRILNSAAPQTNTTWGKLSVSAFQRYWGRGVSDRVYIGKSTISHVDTNGCRNFGNLPIKR